MKESETPLDLKLASRAAVITGTVLAAALGAYRLGVRSFSFDEAYSFVVARMSGLQLPLTIVRIDPSQGLYYLLLHFWLPVGWSEVAIRSLSVAFGVACVPMIYLLGARLFDRKIGATAGILLPLNSYFIEQSQEARGYSLVMLLVIISTYFYVRALEEGGRALWWGYAVSSFLAVFTHAFALFVLIAHGIASLLHTSEERPRRRLVSRGAVVLAAGVVAALPMMKIAFTSDRFSYIQFPNGRTLEHQVGSLIGHRGPVLIVFLFLVCVAAALLVQSFLGQLPRDSAWRLAIMLGWFVIPIVGGIVGSLIIPLLLLRYLSVCIPALALLLAVGLWALGSRWITLTALSVVVVTSASSLGNWYYQPPALKSGRWRDVSAYVLTNARDGDAIIFDGSASAIPFFYYYSSLPEDVDVDFLYLPGVARVPEASVDPLEGVERINDHPDAYRRVWFVTSWGSSLSEVAGTLSETHAPTDLMTSYGALKGHLYVLPDAVSQDP